MICEPGPHLEIIRRYIVELKPEPNSEQIQSKSGPIWCEPIFAREVFYFILFYIMMRV